MRRPPAFDVVVPSAGRPSLRRLLSALMDGEGPPPGRVIVVLDGGATLDESLPSRPGSRVEVLNSAARGPAAARNLGWRSADAEWVAFLDDDVVPPADWRARLALDLSGATSEVGGSQGRIRVPLPSGRRPTDWERNVKGLEKARWATADMAYRRSVLAEVGGFDERFPRAYREDADLGLRVIRAGHGIAQGRRWVEHPVRRAGFWTSVRLQAGNADDALMHALHGASWRAAAEVPGGRRPRHLATTAAALVALAGRAAGAPVVARGGAGLWGAGVAELAWSRISSGPRVPGEVLRMTATSAVLPLAASAQWLAGWARLPLTLRRAGPRATPADSFGAPAEAAAGSFGAPPEAAAR
ncbi:MAG: glycosyltransferase family 2 protein [Actinomycetota bacterium]